MKSLYQYFPYSTRNARKCKFGGNISVIRRNTAADQFFCRGRVIPDHDVTKAQIRISVTFRRACGETILHLENS